MGSRVSRCTLGLVFVALGALGAAPGCTYLRWRGRDALDMVDLGLTFTTTPQFGIYGNCPFIAPGGYAKVDGEYIGIGGGQVGVMKHHQDNVGLLVWGREDVRWEKVNGESGKPEQPAQADSHPQAPEAQAKRVGPLGYAQEPDGTPAYHPQCAHYLHLGFVGVTANLNYRECGDFLLGWFGFDISKDDGKPRGGTAPPTARPRVIRRPPALPRTEFCIRCGGRRLVDQADGAGEMRASDQGLPPAERLWTGRWCICGHRVEAIPGGSPADSNGAPGVGADPPHMATKRP